MNTRSRLISLGLVRPNVQANRAASMAHAIASRRTEMQRTIPVVQKGRSGLQGRSTMPRAN